MNEVTRRLEAIHTELRNLGKDMDGINPKLAHYKTLEKKVEELKWEQLKLMNTRGDRIIRPILIPTT